MNTLKAHARRSRLRKYLPVYLLMLPALLYIFVNNYLPMTGVVLAFKQYSARKGIFGSAWVGLANFKYLFATKDAWIIVRNTVGYNLAFIVLSTVLGIFVAIMMSEIQRGPIKKLTQTVILYPYLISTVVTAYLVYSLLSTDTGFINGVLRMLGKDEVFWYSTPPLLAVHIGHRIPVEEPWLQHHHIPCHHCGH